MILNVYWLFVVPVRQYSLVYGSLKVTLVFIANIVVPSKIWYESSLPLDSQYFVTDTYTSPSLHVKAVTTTETTHEITQKTPTQ